MTRDEWNDICSEVSPVGNLSGVTAEIDVLILAAGFEDRAFRTLPDGSFGPAAHCILIKFENSAPGNDVVFSKFEKEARKKFSSDRVHVIGLAHGEPQQFEVVLRKALAVLPRTLRRLAIDISGIPSYAICLALKVMRDEKPEETQLVLYTAADEYNPTKVEYEKLMKKGRGDIELLPKSMSQEMDENLVLDAFAGHRSQNAKACLAVFAGFEAHRSTGVVEAVNPALLLLIYGNPGDSRFEWRLDLSQKLHRKFEKSRRTAVEVVSTLHVSEALDRLGTYYNYLIDDYDLVISPICSKMHVVATYLFWERYQEVQLTFPVPIGYNPENSPRGIAKTYRLILGPRRSFYRSGHATSTS